jgi:hypothetical protein
MSRPVLALALKVINLQIPLTEKFKTFLPYGYGTQRNNVLSPSTLSERHRLLWLFLNEESDFLHPL